MGISIGLVIGYFFFVYFQSSDVKDPAIRPLVEQDSKTLQRILPEIPLWVKNPDYDRVDWLNRFIELMWPYLDKAICKTAKNIAKPIIAKQIPKYKIDSVEFEELTLGCLPPTFQGMDKLIHDDKGNATISNDGATIMKLLDVVHPVAKILVDIAKSQD
ncbi:hypothetical protein IFM89_037777 [Coptis chinensis]|uniref:SMP-LTD domain-containing protein n=1 Tax=Coptis chinensis TaxID=261450 RepID=A0A835H9H1_9MAGN|nr:hypothetical protein IFM89_037777 [Coptis chinensis]